MTPHAEFGERIAVYRDLGEEDRRAVDEHVRGCAACAAELAAVHKMDHELGRLPVWQHDPRVRQVVVSALRAGSPVPAPRFHWNRLVRRVALASVIAGALLLGGVLLHQLPSPALPARPSSVIPARPSVLFIVGEDIRRVSAVSPQTGAVIGGVQSPRDTDHVVSDGQWTYFLESQRNTGQWQLAITGLSNASDGATRSIALGTFPAQSQTIDLDLAWPVDMALTPDGDTIVLTVAERLSLRWVTRVYIVDLQAARSSPPIDVFPELQNENQPVPFFHAWLVPNGRTLLVAQNQPRLPAELNAPMRWTTQVALVNVAGRRVERTVDVAGEVAAYGLWLDGALSPDGSALYLFETIAHRVESGNEDSGNYRFIAIDLRTQQVSLVRPSGVDVGGERFCPGRALRLTPDGRYLVGYCPAFDSPSRVGALKFLDTQTGLASSLDLDPAVTGEDQAEVVQIVASPDGRTLYVANTLSHSVTAVDLTTRTIGRRATLVEEKHSSLDLLRWLSARLVDTAYAKVFPMPGAVLSADGSRLYFVDVVQVTGEGQGDGLWAVDTATLKPVGHWLRGRDLNALQLSGDGSELYALSPNDGSLYVLDVASGELRRTFDRTLGRPFGFVTP